MSDGERATRERPGFDFFDAGEIVGPSLGAGEVARLLSEHVGLDAPVEQIGSHQDQNFVVRDPAGAEVAILKISNPRSAMPRPPLRTRPPRRSRPPSPVSVPRPCFATPPGRPSPAHCRRARVG
jgi:hypothetical protein